MNNISETAFLDELRENYPDVLRYFFPDSLQISSNSFTGIFGMVSHDKESIASICEELVEHDSEFLSPVRFHLCCDAYDTACEERSIIPQCSKSEERFPELPLSKKAQEIQRELERIKELYGVNDDFIQELLSNVKPSHIRITEKHDIILDDYDGMEVSMDPLTKSVFLLFLKHPEGIRFKDLCDYRDELETIYFALSGKSDTDKMRKSISLITDPLDNSINEKVAKANKAFRDVVGDNVAKHYIIDGPRGEAKKLSLNPGFIIWDRTI